MIGNGQREVQTMQLQRRGLSNSGFRMATAACVAGLAWLVMAGPLSGEEYLTRDFTVTRGTETLGVRVFSPPDRRLAKQPWMLLNFATDRQTSLTGAPYNMAVEAFLKAGHRAASFDLPAHGERIDARGSGIDGMCARFRAGEDPFVQFAGDGRAVIDALIERGEATADRIVVAGTSRAGYCSLRLAAAEPRVAAVAAFAPVTDWRVLREFAEVRDRNEVAELALEHFAKDLAGRAVYIAIGNHDLRVGTDACARFVSQLAGAEGTAEGQSRLQFLIVDDSEGHSLHNRWRDRGSQFLLDVTSR
jgi:dienelactone hydrolase